MLALFFVVFFIAVLAFSAYKEWKLKQNNVTIQKQTHMGDSLKGKTSNVINCSNPPRNPRSLD